ncbi:MAG: SdpI family protein [Gluconobacter cerinus]|uniref:SdpI family protein n=1 Tax=Gluconobacter cerinus TaxID=38307 RepID=UPI0039E76F3D
MQDRYGPIISFAVILTTLAISLGILWMAPPNAMVPVHFSQGWVPDHFVPSLKGLTIWIGLQLGLWTLMYNLPFLRRSGEGFQASVSVYDAAWITVTSTLGILAIASMEQALGIRMAMVSLTDIMMSGFLIIVGNGLGKLRPNTLVGIRTPWTKASVRVWDRTHRASGPVFILAGVVLVAFGFGMFGTHETHHTYLTVVFLLAVFSWGLSWLLWRKEQRP